jgi:hypothetical protein
VPAIATTAIRTAHAKAPVTHLASNTEMQNNACREAGSEPNQLWDLHSRRSRMSNEAPMVTLPNQSDDCEVCRRVEHVDRPFARGTRNRLGVKLIVDMEVVRAPAPDEALSADALKIFKMQGLPAMK